jgi:hypothetical protein
VAGTSPDSLTAKFSSQFGFLEDDETFFNQIAEQAGRGKAKTDYQRRDSNVEKEKLKPDTTAALMGNDVSPLLKPQKSKDKDVITE